MFKPFFGIVYQEAPETLRPWRLLETYMTSEGPRSRIVSGTFTRKEEVEAYKHELEQKFININLPTKEP